MNEATIAYVIVHVLCWGTVGAVLAPRAGIKPWLGAILSALLPCVGTLVLAGLAIWGTNGGPAPQTNRAWLKAGWLGVVAGGLVIVAAWLPWVEFGIGAHLDSLDDTFFTFAMSDYVFFPVAMSLVGLGIAVFSYLAMRRGEREWLVGTALLAWYPITAGAALVLSEGWIDDALRHAQMAETAANHTDVDVAATANYDIGAGPYLTLLAGSAVLIWAFAWSMRSADLYQEGVAGGRSASGAFLGAGATSAIAASGAGGALATSDWAADYSDWDAGSAGSISSRGPGSPSGSVGSETSDWDSTSQTDEGDKWW